MVDGRTVAGPWAFCCDPCWRRFGCGQLGTGHGQRLIVRREVEGEGVAELAPELTAEAAARSAAVEHRAGALVRCPGCGWETVADRCPRCGRDVHRPGSAAQRPADRLDGPAGPDGPTDPEAAT
jgi:hypothetical protein